MPIPVSRTEIRTCEGSTCPGSTVTTTSPRSVYLTALPTRFVSTCRSRCGSPWTAAGRFGSTWATSSTPRAWAGGPSRGAAARARGGGGGGRGGPPPPPPGGGEVELGPLGPNPPRLDLGEVQDVVD